ncbi:MULTISPECIES: hypothetical protein [Brevibacterium]|uniref:Uncharacterized protein n=1 Tax=Brevibacterium aurantiacum TaxID=273384 RepID=A0A2A3X2P3_BREAU|nr:MULTISPECIES: hypothetical protein [Brevibacterium]PCC17928.1 hypothetical protein CIK79_06255 [Brevibacterium aurantiacum]SMX82058.1 hypothetical protein BSP239C_01447 [Brevibacterium sp. 239c]
MTKLTWIGGLVITAFGLAIWALGWFLNTYTGEPGDADIGAGILSLAGLPIAIVGVILVVVGATVAGVNRIRKRKAQDAA